MINRFIIIAFFSFNFIFQVKAQYIEIDLRSDLKGSKNYFGIAARTNTSTGHAYVILGRENDEKQMTEINAQSFYPNHLVTRFSHPPHF